MIGLTEIAEQDLPPASHGFAIAEQGLDFLPLDMALPVCDVAAVEQPEKAGRIGHATGHPGIGRQPVAAGPAGFLIIGFEALRRVKMSDKPDIRLVDPHAESHRRDDYDAFLAQKPILVARPHRCLEAGVVGKSIAAARLEPGCGFLNRSARQAVHDAGIAGMLRRQKLPELFQRTAFGHHAVEYIGPVIAGGKDLRFGQIELFDDVAPGRPVGSRGQCNHRDAGKALLEDAELLVVGPEIVPPLRDAMSLVDGKEGDRTAREKLQAARGHEALGRNIEQIQRRRANGLLDLGDFARGQARIERAGPHPSLAQRLHLILHQRDQRRNDDAQTGAQQGGDLIAQRLAAARRHQHDGILASDHMLDNCQLLATESVEAEDLAQHFERRALPRTRIGLRR